MDRSLSRSEAQTTWAGRLLLGLGLVGALGGLLSGFATARGLMRQSAQLSVRVQAVQSQLDQEIGATASAAAGRFFGTTSPAETMSFIASSMLNALSVRRCDSTTITSPVIGFGAVGMTTEVIS